MNEFQKDHIQRVAANFQNFFASDKFLDVTISLRDSQVHSNRLLLSASSDYFHGLFEFYGSQSGSSLSTHYDITSEYLSAKGFEFVINFIHSLGQCSTLGPQEDYESMYTAASFLQVHSLQEMLSDLIGNHLNTFNVIRTLRLAHLFDDNQLYNKSLLLLLDQFHHIDVYSDDYVTLTQDQLESIFRSDRVNVPRESFMVKALLSWVSADVQSRMNFFKVNFTQLIRLSLVSANEFALIVTDPRFSSARDALDLLILAYRTQTGSLSVDFLYAPKFSNSLGTFPISNTTVRSGANFRIYSFGGIEGAEFSDTLQRDRYGAPGFFCYDSDMAQVCAYPSVDEPNRIHHALASSLGWIFVAGGELEDGELLSRCSKYNLVEHTWIAMEALDAPRSHHSLVCIESFLYAFGGYRLNWSTGYSPATDSILMYDCIANKWRSAPHRLPFAGVDMGTVLITSKRLVLIAGGLHEDGAEMRASDSVILYDPSEESSSCFTFVSRLPIPLIGVSLAYGHSKEYVFACGGKTDIEHASRSDLCTGLLFNQILTYSLETNSWCSITVLDFPRYCASAFVSRSTLYVIGGVTADEVVESMAHFRREEWRDYVLSSGTEQQHLWGDSIDHLCLANGPRPSVLQAPYRVCHFAEAWQLDATSQQNTNWSTSESFNVPILPPRPKRLKCPPTRHKNGPAVFTRCFSAYCLAPHYS